MLKRITLAPNGCPPQRVKILVFGRKRQATQFTRNLVCQLAGRTQHQRLGLKKRRIDMLQQAAKAPFSTAFRLHAHVTALKNGKAAA
jgi:hypothetical protein